MVVLALVLTAGGYVLASLGGRSSSLPANVIRLPLELEVDP